MSTQLSKQPTYFFKRSLILIIAILFVAFFLMGIDSRAYLLEILKPNDFFLFLWRLVIYSLLLVMWPILIQRKERGWSHTQFVTFRRYLLILIVSYELIIVFNPLQLFISVFLLGGK